MVKILDINDELEWFLEPAPSQRSGFELSAGTGRLLCSLFLKKITKKK